MAGNETDEKKIEQPEESPVEEVEQKEKKQEDENLLGKNDSPKEDKLPVANPRHA